MPCTVVLTVCFVAPSDVVWCLVRCCDQWLFIVVDFVHVFCGDGCFSARVCSWCAVELACKGPLTWCQFSRGWT